jgi:hypothetical protein
VAAKNRRTHLRRHIDGVDRVFQPNRNAMQRPTARPAVEVARLGESEFRIEIHKRFDDIVTRRDARDAMARHCLACRLAARDFCRDPGRGQLIERTFDFRVHFQFFPARPAELPAIWPNTVPDIRPDPPG